MPQTLKFRIFTWTFPTSSQIRWNWIFFKKAKIFSLENSYSKIFENSQVNKHTIYIRGTSRAQSSNEAFLRKKWLPAVNCFHKKALL